MLAFFLLCFGQCLTDWTAVGLIMGFLFGTDARHYVVAESG